MVSHWLMKTEPDTFSIDDLARVKVEPWTGVRNYMARNLMRDRMQVGDEVLFYHSSCEPPGVAGLARVVRTGVVDATQFDPQSKYHDADSPPDAPRWICVDVEYVRHAPRFVPLAELRAHPGLAGMVLLQRGARLSVQPVSAAHYEIIRALAETERADGASGQKSQRASGDKSQRASGFGLRASGQKKAAPDAKTTATKVKAAAETKAKTKAAAKAKPAAKTKPKPKPNAQGKR